MSSPLIDYEARFAELRAGTPAESGYPAGRLRPRPATGHRRRAVARGLHRLAELVDSGPVTTTRPAAR